VEWVGFARGKAERWGDESGGFLRFGERKVLRAEVAFLKRGGVFGWLDWV
jgi:hypothetical protein